MEKRGQFATAQEDEERRKASQLRKEVDTLFKRRKKLRNDMYAVPKAAGVQQPANNSTPVSPTTAANTAGDSATAAERGRSGRRQSAPDAAAVQSADAVAAAVAAAALAPQRASLSSSSRARGSPQRPLPPSAAAADMRRSKSAQNMKQMASGSATAAAAASASDAARGASASPSPPLTEERGKQSAWRKMKGLFTGNSGSSSRDSSRPRSATPTRGSSASNSSAAAAAAAAATAAAGAAAATSAASPRPRSDSDDAGPELDLAQVKEALRSQKEELQAVEQAYAEKRKKLAEHQLKAQRLQTAAREAEANMAGPMSAWHALAARVEAHVDAYLTRVADSTAGRSKSAYSSAGGSPAGRGWYGEREGGDLW
jgi:trimeric autotransporter adhesin